MGTVHTGSDRLVPIYEMRILFETAQNCVGTSNSNVMMIDEVGSRPTHTWARAIAMGAENVDSVL